GAYDVCLTDEAYMVPWRDLPPALLVGRQQILIGDPGQLPPVIEVETEEWAAMPDGPHLPSPIALEWQRGQPGSPLPPLRRLRLPTPLRLRPAPAALVQRHFYPTHPFVAERRGDGSAWPTLAPHPNPLPPGEAGARDRGCGSEALDRL